MNLSCQACKKQPATVHLTDIAPGGEKRERHLCESCAQEEGIMPQAQAPTAINELFSGFLAQNKAAIQELANLACPHCKMRFVEFRNAGLLGCPHDYDAFERALLPLIERAHEGASHHIGKVPRRLGEARASENDLMRLRRELTRAVDNEKFEEAARLRDRIRILESE